MTGSIVVPGVLLRLSGGQPTAGYSPLHAAGGGRPPARGASQREDGRALRRSPPGDHVRLCWRDWSSCRSVLAAGQPGAGAAGSAGSSSVSAWQRHRPSTTRMTLATPPEKSASGSGRAEHRAPSGRSDRDCGSVVTCRRELQQWHGVEHAGSSLLCRPARVGPVTDSIGGAHEATARASQAGFIRPEQAAAIQADAVNSFMTVVSAAVGSALADPARADRVVVALCPPNPSMPPGAVTWARPMSTTIRSPDEFEGEPAGARWIVDHETRQAARSLHR